MDDLTPAAQLARPTLEMVRRMMADPQTAQLIRHRAEEIRQNGEYMEAGA